jgi:hypothetical protein
MRVTKIIFPTVELTAEQNEVKQQNATVTLYDLYEQVFALTLRAKARHHWIREQDLKEVIQTVVTSATESPTGEVIQSWVWPGLARQSRDTHSGDPDQDLRALMLCLFRQSGGFDGLGAIREPLVAEDLSLAEREDDPVVQLTSAPLARPRTTV